MWSAQEEILLENRTIRYRITQQGEICTFKNVFALWMDNQDFRSFYQNLLAQSSFAAFFWEHPAVTESNLEEEYEFVLIKSPNLARVQADSHAFQSYFNTDEIIVDFSNLRGDAHLLVPTPIDTEDAYPHLAQFIRKAPTHQVDQLFASLARLLKEKIDEQHRWLSTAGLGVSWLHIRLDTRPKYYRYQPYKKY